MDAQSNVQRWMLVVEDNIDDERMATRIFHNVHRPELLIIARDGVEALALLQEKDPPALVLLDLKLPRLSGLELLTAIRDDERIRSIPVVILTSSDERTDTGACYACGCNGFVRKAMDYKRYVADLTATFDFWLGVNCMPPIELPIKPGDDLAPTPEAASLA